MLLLVLYVFDRFLWLLLSVAYQMMEHQVNKSLHIIDYIHLRKQNEEIPLGFRSGLIHNSCIPAIHLICNSTMGLFLLNVTW
jgi:hypothetical protein